MKLLLFTLSLFVLLLLYTSSPAQSAFDQYSGFETDNNGKGKGKGGGSIVPEPAVYGAGLIGLSLLVFLYRRNFLSRKH